MFSPAEKIVLNERSEWKSIFSVCCLPSFLFVLLPLRRERNASWRIGQQDCFQRRGCGGKSHRRYQFVITCFSEVRGVQRSETERGWRKAESGFFVHCEGICISSDSRLGMRMKTPQNGGFSLADNLFTKINCPISHISKISDVPACLLVFFLFCFYCRLECGEGGWLGLSFLFCFFVRPNPKRLSSDMWCRAKAILFSFFIFLKIRRFAATTNFAKCGKTLRLRGVGCRGFYAAFVFSHFWVCRKIGAWGLAPIFLFFPAWMLERNCIIPLRKTAA